MGSCENNIFWKPESIIRYRYIFNYEYFYLLLKNMNLLQMGDNRKERFMQVNVSAENV